MKKYFPPLLLIFFFSLQRKKEKKRLEKENAAKDILPVSVALLLLTVNYSVYGTC